MDKTWHNFKVDFARAVKDTRDSNKTSVNSRYANLVKKMQNYM